MKKFAKNVPWIFNFFQSKSNNYFKFILYRQFQKKSFRTRHLIRRLCVCFFLQWMATSFGGTLLFIFGKVKSETFYKTFIPLPFCFSIFLWSLASPKLITKSLIGPLHCERVKHDRSGKQKSLVIRTDPRFMAVGSWKRRKSNNV